MATGEEPSIDYSQPPVDVAAQIAETRSLLEETRRRIASSRASCNRIRERMAKSDEYVRLSIEAKSENQNVSYTA